LGTKRLGRTTREGSITRAGGWNFSDRERDVMCLLVEGLPNKLIADRLGVASGRQLLVGPANRASLAAAVDPSQQPMKIGAGRLEASLYPVAIVINIESRRHLDFIKEHRAKVLRHPLEYEAHRTPPYMALEKEMSGYFLVGHRAKTSFWPIRKI
jgi:hypothetical protein